MKYCEIKKSDNLEVNRLFDACTQKIFNEYQNDTSGNSKFAVLKNIFYSFGVNIYLNHESDSDNNYINISMAKK